MSVDSSLLGPTTQAALMENTQDLNTNPARDDENGRLNRAGGFYAAIVNATLIDIDREIANEETLSNAITGLFPADLTFQTLEQRLKVLVTLESESKKFQKTFLDPASDENVLDQISDLLTAPRPPGETSANPFTRALEEANVLTRSQKELRQRFRGLINLGPGSGRGDPSPEERNEWANDILELARTQELRQYYADNIQRRRDFMRSDKLTQEAIDEIVATLQLNEE